MTDTKALTGVEIKDAEEGIVEAVFAKFNVKDHDNDVTLPGAFEDGAKVRISAWGHSSWGPSRGASSVPQPPVGKGVIRVVDDEARLEGQFFLKTQAGRDHFEVIKEMGDQQEWSYGYDTADFEMGEFEGEKVRFLKSQIVHEVSPVMLGAGIGTRTLAVKGKQLDSDLRESLQEAGTARYGGQDIYVWVDDIEIDAGWVVFCVSSSGENDYRKVGYSRAGDGTTTLADGDEQVERTTTYTAKDLSFAEEADHALGSVKAFIQRAQDLGSLRAGEKEGRVLNAANRGRLTTLATSLAEAEKELAALLAETDPNKHRDDVMREVLRFERLRAQL